MRFLPSLRTVQEMGKGRTPQQAVERALDEILEYYPDMMERLLLLINGEFGGAAAEIYRRRGFPYVVRHAGVNETELHTYKPDADEGVREGSEGWSLW